MNNESNIKEIGLYIHIPFCKSKCRYCDFNSYPSMEEHIPQYIATLKRELSYFVTERSDLAVKSIFIGGGTPSLLKGDEIEDLLQHVNRCVYVNPEAEITIESNPGTLERTKLDGYRAAGVNRLSIGLQAWQNTLLETLGRIHTSAQFQNSYEAARAAGFNNINIDLIFGIPGQTIKDWEETLKQVTGLRPEHLSCYSLSIEEDTVFGKLYEKGKLIPATDELDREMYWKTIEYLTAKGYHHYEISNFAKEGYACRHNLIYWRADEYLGIGAGAHSYLDRRRWGNHRSVEHYIDAVNKGRSPMEDIQAIDSRESAKEYLILGLRLLSGIDAENFHARFGISLEDVYGKQINDLVSKGLLQKQEKKIFLTNKGLDLANSVFVEFLD